MTARVRTGFSFRNAVGKLPEVADRLVAIGANAAPITDTASTFGFVKWDKLCKERGLRPVFGVELNVSPSINAKTPAMDGWTFIAHDTLLPLHRLIGVATEQFRYTPLLSVEQAIEATADVTVIVGARSPVEWAAHQTRHTDNCFIEVGPAMARGQMRAYLDAGFEPIACSDNRFPQEGGEGYYEIICGRNASTQSYPQWILSDDEWISYMGRQGFDGKLLARAIDNRDRVLARSVATLLPAEMVTPPRPDSLEVMCRQGAERLGCDLTREAYEARLMRELNLIKDKAFEDYFYLVADICQWARARMIVGPARGSSCGSLVCYLLGITSIDPLPYNLIFERFIDINRADLPDIDIDFPEDRRSEVFEYVAQKYGRERVARLGTVAMYQPRSALKEAAGAMDVPPWKLDKVMDAIIDRSSGDSRALQATYDTLHDTEAGRALMAEYPEILASAQMEGHPRHAGQHAAGIVITEKPVSTYVAVDHRTGATMCDKKDAEGLNLLKIDALGLTQLSVFEKALKLAGLDRDHLFTIPLDDPAAFKVLNDHRYSGIFQFNGLALQSITDQIVIESLEDIAAIGALARPGPMNTGGTKQWIAIKRGEAEPTYPHPLFESILRDTMGIITYQEQVMTIGREIGGLGWGDVTALRKTMSNRLGGEAFDRYGDLWKKGAIERGVPPEIVNQVWGDLTAYGSWAFNKSHSVAYGTLSYYCCWLKAYYPVEFAAATLTHTDDPLAQIKMLRELAAEGVGYIPADLDLSSDQWTVGVRDGQKVLVGPLSNVHGVGPKMMSTIISARARGEPIPERAKKLLTDPKTKIDSLFPIKTQIERLMPDPTAKNIFSTPARIIDIQPSSQARDVLVFAVVSKIKPKDENEEVNVAKRGGKVFEGPTQALNLWISDDTDTMFAKVWRFEFERHGRPIIERGRAGKALYAIKGRVPPNMRILSVKNVRYIGDLDD